jgi:hypothetical protein
MHAMRAERFGGYQDLKLVEIPKPAVSHGKGSRRHFGRVCIAAMTKGGL